MDCLRERLVAELVSILSPLLLGMALKLLYLKDRKALSSMATLLLQCTKEDQQGGIRRLGQIL
jgi:hypothetical protein